MTPKEFIQKWKRVEQKERSVAQQHLLDLCELLGHDKSATAQILEKLLALNLERAAAEGRTAEAAG